MVVLVSSSYLCFASTGNYSDVSTRHLPICILFQVEKLQSLFGSGNHIYLYTLISPIIFSHHGELFLLT